MRDIDGRIIPDEIIEGIKVEILNKNHINISDLPINITSVQFDKKNDEYSVEYIYSGFSHIRINKTYLIRKIKLKELGVG